MVKRCMHIRSRSGIASSHCKVGVIDLSWNSIGTTIAKSQLSEASSEPMDACTIELYAKEKRL